MYIIHGSLDDLLAVIEPGTVVHIEARMQQKSIGGVPCQLTSSLVVTTHPAQDAVHGVNVIVEHADILALSPKDIFTAVEHRVDTATACVTRAVERRGGVARTGMLLEQHMLDDLEKNRAVQRLWQWTERSADPLKRTLQPSDTQPAAA